MQPSYLLLKTNVLRRTLSSLNRIILEREKLWYSPGGPCPVPGPPEPVGPGGPGGPGEPSLPGIPEDPGTPGVKVTVKYMVSYDNHAKTRTKDLATTAFLTYALNYFGLIHVDKWRKNDSMRLSKKI